MRYINSLLTLTLALTDRQADRYETYLHWRGYYAFTHASKVRFLSSLQDIFSPLLSAMRPSIVELEE